MNEAITSLVGGRVSELLAISLEVFAVLQAAFKDLDISDPTTLDPTTLFSHLKDLGFLPDPWAKLAETAYEVPREPEKLLASSR